MFGNRYATAMSTEVIGVAKVKTPVGGTTEQPIVGIFITTNDGHAFMTWTGHPTWEELPSIPQPNKARNLDA